MDDAASLEKIKSVAVLDIIIDIVIEIHDFRNVDEKFIPKEVAVVAINATIIGHWIMMQLYTFSDLPKRDEKTTGFRRIIMALNGSTAKPISNIFALQLREITINTLHIYQRARKNSLFTRITLQKCI